MKVLAKILGGLVVCVVVLLIVLRFTGFEPKDRRPGLWLKGDVATTPITDWTFTDQVETVKLQTTTWYLLPHSVTTNCIEHDGQLYLTSIYPHGVQYPHGRTWNEYIARDPHILLKVGGKLYHCTLTVVPDGPEKDAALADKWKKYPELKVPKGGTVILFHVVNT